MIHRLIDSVFLMTYACDRSLLPIEVVSGYMVVQGLPHVRLDPR